LNDISKNKNNVHISRDYERIEAEELVSFAEEVIDFVESHRSKAQNY